MKTLLTRGRPTDPLFVPEQPGAWRSERWSFKVTASEANAWLNVRLPLWLGLEAEHAAVIDKIAQAAGGTRP